MLRTLCESFKKDGHEVTAAVNKSLKREAGFLPIYDLVFPRENPMEELPETSSSFDAAFIIAPESGGKLLELTRAIEQETELLSCPSGTVSRLANKPSSFELVDQQCNFLSVPRTLTTESTTKEISRAIPKMGLPLVIKPPDGAGCEGTTIVRSNSDCRRAAAKLRSSGWNSAIIQEFKQGRHLSATFMAMESEVIPLAINTQAIQASQELEYLGGSSPFPLPVRGLWDDISSMVTKSKLKGLMTLDFVYSQGKAHFMEINPRMTTSCIGIEKIIQKGLASIITGEKTAVDTEGFSKWSILPLIRTVPFDQSIHQKMFQSKMIVSPPFPVGPYYMKGKSKVLTCVWAKDSMEIPQRFARVKKWLSERHIKC